MATDRKTPPIQVPTPSASSVAQGFTAKHKPSGQVSLSESRSNPAFDLFVLHIGADALWSKYLAERLRGIGVGDRGLRIDTEDWNSAIEPGRLMEEKLRECGYVGIVISKGIGQEVLSAVLKMIGSAERSAAITPRVVILLKENVNLPPILRLGEWIDFRDERYFEESLSDLACFIVSNSSGDEVCSPVAGARVALAKRSTPSQLLSSSGVCATKERVLSNLFPVVELPRFVYSTETHCQTESEVTELCPEPGPLAFLLKGSKLFTTESLSRDSVFAPALSSGAAPAQESFSQWLSRSDRPEWAMELLNKLFRHHAWKRGLRWDSTTEQYYFPRTKPKSIWWEIGKQTVSREVTAPNMEWIELEDNSRAEVQFGWKHQGIRTGFVQVQGNIFLRVEPSWLLTELDSKTPATTEPVAPVFAGFPQQERNGQTLRSLRFWSAVLAKGHHEIRINTGQAPVRIRLTPVSGLTQVGIPSDQMDYDQLMLKEGEDDLLIPVLGPVEQESITSHEEVIPSQTLTSSRRDQSQASIQHSSAGD